MNNDQIDVERELAELAKSGKIKQVGFGDDGSDLFQMTPAGIKMAETLIKQNPGVAIFLLQVAWQSNGIDGFKKMLEKTASLYNNKK